MLSPNISLAADHYVRADAIGDNSGSDWTNAFTQLPLTLVRGDTYYIADGNYGSYTFNDATSGSTYIYIKKATTTDHGTDTGWDSSYGDGQAVFEGTSNILNFISGYYIWDGQVGSGGDSSSYGFRVTVNDCSNLSQRMVGMPGIGYSKYKVRHIIFSHTAISACGEAYDPAVQVPIYSAPRDETYRAEYITLSNNFFEKGSTNILIRQWSNGIIENNYFDNQWSSPTNHGQQISPGNNSDDIIVRGNIFKDSLVFVLGIHKADNERWKVYNNIVIGGSLTAAFANADSSTEDVVKDSEFYNNTFVNVDFGGRGAVFVGKLTDVENDKSFAYNNLFYNCVHPNFNAGSGTIKYGYSAHFGSTGTYDSDEDGTAQIGSGDPFVDSMNGDYRLVVGTANGKTLSSPFDIDIRGYIRGVDGIWDRGAYELLLPPRNLIVQP